MSDETVYIKQATKSGYIECAVGGVADLSYPDSTTRRGRVQGGGNICPTITSESMGICRIESALRGGWSAEPQNYQNYQNDTERRESVENADQKVRYRIRKLTPRECWRLMDFSDEDFEKAEQISSNTQLYKQAGNSIVCNVLVAIMGQMFSGKETVYQERAEQNFFNQSV